MKSAWRSKDKRMGYGNACQRRDNSHEGQISRRPKYESESKNHSSRQDDCGCFQQRHCKRVGQSLQKVHFELLLRAKNRI
jgi:hypothetical protein